MFDGVAGCSLLTTVSAASWCAGGMSRQPICSRYKCAQLGIIGLFFTLSMADLVFALAMPPMTNLLTPSGLHGDLERPEQGSAVRNIRTFTSSVRGSATTRVKVRPEEEYALKIRMISQLDARTARWPKLSGKNTVG